MDIPQLEEDEAMVAMDPLDVIEHVLAAENLRFERSDEGDLVFSLSGAWKEYELWFAWRSEADCLQLCLSLDLQAVKKKKAAAHELLALVNPRVWLGHFELWPEGDVVFRHALNLPAGERPSIAQAASAIDAAIEAADRFYPAFDLALNNGKSPQDAMDACLFETVGEA